MRKVVSPVAGYGGIASIPKRQLAWAPPTDAQKVAAEDFLIEVMWHGAVDIKVVQRPRRHSGIHRGALTIARERL